MTYMLDYTYIVSNQSQLWSTPNTGTFQMMEKENIPACQYINHYKVMEEIKKSLKNSTSHEPWDDEIAKIYQA